MNEIHRPVLLQEATEILAVDRNDIVVDATLGGSGHARELVRTLGPKGIFIGFDLDADAIERAREALADASCKIELIEANFRDIQQQLEARGITRITKALFDLGWSSYQLDSGRGFSIHAEEPLLMTYAKAGSLVTARVVVNDWAEETLADIIYGFGEERYSRRIAKAIVEHRARRPIETAPVLAEIIFQAVPMSYRHGRIHPATRTFQAIRMAVNDELGAIEKGLRGALNMLDAGGRIAVITFHSIEDRLVKRTFAQWEKDGRGHRVTKKPHTASAEELKDNRRARSAKLRVFEKYDKEITENKQVQTLDPAGEI